MVMKMVVQINRYEIKDGKYYSKSGKAKVIIDYLEYQEICSIDTNNEELNQILAEIVLKELNTGKYEKINSDIEFNGDIEWD